MRLKFKLKYCLIAFLTLLFKVQDANGYAFYNENYNPVFSGWDFTYMTYVKEELIKGKFRYYPAYIKLVEEAGKEMERGPWSVTFKNVVPPGGTKNDYMSYGPYWWPDTTKPGGLPYIRRDGITNPENGIDRRQLGNFTEAIRKLSLAWFFTDDIKYAARAVYLLKVWFLNPETKMNPGLEFAQGIPGITAGRGIGIIDIRGFHTLTDAVSLLYLSGELENDDLLAIKKWFRELFVWLTSSKNGHDEDNTKNNHAVAYDVIVSGIARFIGDDEFAMRKISEMPARRIETMIETDGRQPEELVRTKAFGYSVANLRNFFDAGIIGLRLNTDIFHYINQKGASLMTALDFLVAYTGKSKQWPWDEIGQWEQTENSLGLLVRTASVVYKNEKYLRLWQDVFAERLKSDWTLLVYPGP